MLPVPERTMTTGTGTITNTDIARTLRHFLLKKPSSSGLPAIHRQDMKLFKLTLATSTNHRTW
jgi:hypothetical protein